jgi:uncharacterized repeat protein (TIGR01451 family)
MGDSGTPAAELISVPTDARGLTAGPGALPVPAAAQPSPATTPTETGIGGSGGFAPSGGSLARATLGGIPPASAGDSSFVPSGASGPSSGPSPPAGSPPLGDGVPETNGSIGVGTPTSLSDVAFGSGEGTPDAAARGAAGMTSDVPGDQRLEGQQTPAIALEKIAPQEIQVDRETTFQIRVRNVGNATAHQVMVVDQIPRGTEFVGAKPECSRGSDGTVFWRISEIKPGEETVLSLQLLPKVAGEIGSVAQATIQAQASVRTICTKPQLQLELSVSESVLIGGSATLDIAVTNSGTGAATNVVLEEDVPEGFAHAAGRQLEHEIGTLRPQESRRLSLALEAVKPGVYENRLTVRADANLRAEDLRQIQVVAPELKVKIQGPSLRYLDRQAVYTISIVNPGTAAARNVELATYLPKGVKFVSADNQGQYDTQTHAVYWSLDELPANRQGDVQITVLPLEPGALKLKAAARAELGLTAAEEYEVTVESLPELVFTLADLADPIEVGSNTTYEVIVQNRGSQADTNVQLITELPPGLTPLGGSGPTQGTAQGQQVVFAPLARLAPGEEAVFKINATGQAVGDHVIRAQLRSEGLRVPVTKEESTRVYTDR